MSEIIKVKINTDAVTATEVNPEGGRPFYFSSTINDYCRDFPKWQEAESKLRTFKIDMNDLYELCSEQTDPEGHISCEEDIDAWIDNAKALQKDKLKIGIIHSAKILDNDKLTIRIL